MSRPPLNGMTDGQAMVGDQERAPANLPPPAKMGDRDYRVYDALLRTMFFEADPGHLFAQVRRDTITRLVIMNRTFLGLPPPTIAAYSRGHELVKKELGLIGDNQYEAFLKLNENIAFLEDRFSLPAAVTLLDQEASTELFDEMSRIGWDRFWILYRQSQGVAVLSRIAFDDKGGLALVCAGSEQSGKQGAGYCAAVVRSGDAWSVRKTALLWESQAATPG